jgi:hypothetical protein
MPVIRIPVSKAMYERSVLIGAGNGIMQYEQLNAYVRDKSPHTIVGWERDRDGELFALVDPTAKSKTRGGEIGRPRPA